MPDIEKIGRDLAEELRKHKADYLEARLEESHSSSIVYRGKTLESIGRSSSSGGNVRALDRGGWGFTSFNSFDDVSTRPAIAVEQARAAGSGKSELAAVPAAREHVHARGEGHRRGPAHQQHLESLGPVAHQDHGRRGPGLRRGPVAPLSQGARPRHQLVGHPQLHRSVDLDDDLDLHRGVEGEHGDPDGRARVDAGLAERRAEQLTGAVDDAGLAGEVGR